LIPNGRPACAAHRRRTGARRLARSSPSAGCTLLANSASRSIRRCRLDPNPGISYGGGRHTRQPAHHGLRRSESQSRRSSAASGSTPPTAGVSGPGLMPKMQPLIPTPRIWMLSASPTGVRCQGLRQTCVSTAANAVGCAPPSLRVAASPSAGKGPSTAPGEASVVLDSVASAGGGAFMRSLRPFASLRKE